MARAEGWYEPDDEVDAHLPYLTRDCNWEDTTWRANEHSFSLLLERYVRPGMRVLEVGAAKAWAAQHLVPLGVEYVATDILADPNIGLGRGAFFEARVGPFARVQADGEHLPFATGAFDLVYCVAALHHALDLERMVGELARVTRRGGTVAALNEGTRAVRASGQVEDQEHEKSFGINEHVHTLYAYLWAFWRAGLAVRRVEHAEGDDDLREPADRREAAPDPARRPLGRDLVRADLLRLQRRQPVRDEAAMSLSVNVMTRGPGDRVAAMLSLFPRRRGRDPRRARRPRRRVTEAAIARCRRPGGPLPVRRAGRPAAAPGSTTECSGEWVLTIDDDEIPSRGLLDSLPELGRGPGRHALLAPAPLALPDARPLPRRAAVAARLPASARAQRSTLARPSRTRPTCRSRCSGRAATSPTGSTTRTRCSTRGRRGRRRRSGTSGCTRGSASPGGR